MKRVLTALILIPFVLLLVFLGPHWQWLFTLAVAGVAVLVDRGARERVADLGLPYRAAYIQAELGA